MSARAAVWMRVSTEHQDTENQERAIAQFCEHHGYAASRYYDVSASGLQWRRRWRRVQGRDTEMPGRCLPGRIQSAHLLGP